MKRYAGYRIMRIAVQVVVTAVITVATIIGVPCLFAKMQIVPAIAACSVIWLLLWLAATLIAGRIYCSTVCPAGALMDLAAFVTRRRKDYYTYSQPHTRLRTFFLIIMVVCGLISVSIVVSILDPYSAFCRIVNACYRPLSVGTLSLLIAAALLAVIVLVARRNGRLICNTICPVGSALGIVSRAALYHADINTDLCTNCGRCVDKCPSQCIDLTCHKVDSTRCVVCFDCMAVCPNNAITYTRWRHRLSTPLMMRISRPGIATGSLCMSSQPSADSRLDNPTQQTNQNPSKQ